MSGDAFHHQRAFSQSRFTPSANNPPNGFSTLEKNHRSKSFDNRREFWSPNNDASSRINFATEKNGGFNESVTIPIQKTGNAENYTYFDKAPVKQYRSAVELRDDDDNEWTSYDRTVRYNHNRTELPPVRVGPQYYSGYSSRRHHIEPQTTYAIRYPESDYASHIAHQQQQQQYQQQQQHHMESLYQQRQLEQGRAAEAAAGVYRPQAYYDDGASTYGRTAVAASSGGGAGGHRSYRSHQESHKRTGGGGSQHYSQYYANGYGHSNGATHHKSRVNTNKGGFFGNKNQNKAYYRDTSLPLQKRPTVHHKIQCCCFSFYWPPWGYERCEPPTPIFYNRKAFAKPPPSHLSGPQISPGQRASSHRMTSPEPPNSTANQYGAPHLQPPPPSLLHPNQAGRIPGAQAP